MDIRQLEAFVYTVKYQSFSLAAQKLYISQPTVSAHIRSLEEEFHTQLLKRTTKSLSLTPAGTKLYSYATEILTLQQKAIVELANETKPQLRIGASSVPSLYFLPELLSAYHAVHPDIRVYASCSDSLDVVHKVDDGICDIGLVGTTTSDTSCEFLPFASDELVIDDLNVIAVMDDAAALKQCIMLGMGISILSKATVQADARQGKLLLFPLGEAAFLRKLYLVYSPVKYMAEEGGVFLEFAKRFYQL